MTSGHNSLSNLNLFRLAFPLSTVTRCSLLLRLCLHGFRPGREEVSSLHLSTQHWFCPLPLTFLARRASRFALDPLIYRIFAQTKRGERMHFRNLNVAPPKDDNPMPIADLLVDRAYGQSILSFMDGHLGRV